MVLGLAVLEVVANSMAPTLRADLLSLVPALVTTLQLAHITIRHMAARALVAIATRQVCFVGVAYT